MKWTAIGGPEITDNGLHFRVCGWGWNEGGAWCPGSSYRLSAAPGEEGTPGRPENWTRLVRRWHQGGDGWEYGDEDADGDGGR